MRYVRRELESVLKAASRNFPAAILTGPRRAGKTYLLRHVLPDASYHLFEDPDVVARFRSDPQGFLDDLQLPVILDEVQNVPELFAYVRSRIDLAPRRTGQWFLTGSQEAGLMRNVAESMAGRAAVLQLWPMSVRETDRVGMLRGGFPEVLARPRMASLWFSSFLQTYLERDVRSITAVENLVTFRRFVALLASRHGQVLNKTDMAAPLGVSVPTIGRWLDVLEMTSQVLIVPPYFENLGKRLIKSPKVYLADSGLACHLLGIETESDLARSPFLGALFEGFVAAEIIKAQSHAGRRRELYYFRDQQGLEVDFLFPGRAGHPVLLEAKVSRTVFPGMATPMRRLASSLEKGPESSGTASLVIVHGARGQPASSSRLIPGVLAVPWPQFARDDLPRLLGLGRSG